MPNTVFFSWQLDTPTDVGRNLIDRALNRAAGQIGADTDVEEAVRELEVDKDTKGVPGFPPVVDTIFRKIDKAAVFVPDLTFVGKRLDGRPTPNPNVLIEYGWALRALGYERIVPVMNVAFGKPDADSMPFDMRHLRYPLTYSCPAGADEETRKKARDGLIKEFERRIRDVLGSEAFKATLPSPPEPPKFPEQEPKDGRGRFRAKGELLGISSGFLYMGPQQIRLSDGPAIWLRLMPSVHPGRAWSLEQLKDAATKYAPFLGPLNFGWRDFTYVSGPDGFGVCAPVEDSETPSIAYAFTTGEVWATDAYLIPALAANRNEMPLLEAELGQSFAQYAAFLERLGVAPPYRWIAGAEGLMGKKLFIPPPTGHMSFGGPRGECMKEVVEATGLHVPDAKPRTSLRPFFASLYQACGQTRPDYLDPA